MVEGRDWARSQFERCPDCGADPSTLVDGSLGREVSREIAAWGRLLAAADPVRVRARPVDDVWSALEYACHVRDLLPVMTERLSRIRSEDEPSLGWWDHEASVIDDHYNEQVPVLVVEAMTRNARDFAAALALVEAEEWDRGADRRPGERFTVRGIARFVLHEVIHHRDDAARSLKGVVS
jgi:hypothetical protein